MTSSPTAISSPTPATSTLSGPFTIADNQATNELCPATATLAPLASITCTASDTIDQADLDAGSLTNTATASNGSVTSNQDSETVTAVTDPELTLVKTATPGTYDSVGDVISYSYLVTNTGNVTLSGPFTIADDQATNEACPATAALAPNASITCTASDTIDQGDLDAGSLTNTATASNGAVTSNQDSETVTGTQTRTLSLVKTASPSVYSTVGDPIDYTYTVTNTGNVTLTGPFTVTDDQVGVSCPAGNLIPGASLVCTATDTVTQADIDAGSITNVASATNGTTTSNTDTKTVIAAQGPDLELVKTATPGTYNAVGNVISYSYLVTNIGNVTLDGPVSVADDKVAVTCPAVATLAPNAFVTCTSTYTITQADLDAGSVTNTANATADGVTSLDDSATVNAAQGPALTIDKSATPSTFDSVGDSISYTYTVTNSGNVSLTGPFTVSDDKTTVTCPSTSPLAVGAHITCTATYAIKQADLDAGSVTNIASATNGSVTSNTDTETVTATQGPALTLAKTPTPTTYAAVGDVIDYAYVVTNSGNVSLTGPFTVTDDKTTVTCPSTSPLAVGAHITCTSSYTITQADINAGTVTNTASATNGSVTSNTDTATVTAAQGPDLDTGQDRHAIDLRGRR